MFGSAKQLFSGEIYLQNQYQEETLGQLGQDRYGDFFQYGKVGAANISAGKLQLAPTQKTNHHNAAAYAAVTADGRNRKVTLTLGATAAVVNEYAEGYLVANDNTPEGQTYRVLGHPAAAQSTTLEVTVERPFITSITTASEFTLVHNKLAGVVEDTTITKRAAGVPLIPMTALYYGWFKISGVAAVLIGTAATLGAPLIASSGTAGAVTDQTDNLGASAELQVAVASIALGVSTEYNPVQLTIKP
jgi:hypothetical protein